MDKKTNTALHIVSQFIFAMQEEHPHLDIDILASRLDEMLEDEAKLSLEDVKHGLYKIHWKEGGHSLAAIGSYRDGARWVAVTNWISAQCDFEGVKDKIKRLELLQASKY